MELLQKLKHAEPLDQSEQVSGDVKYSVIDHSGIKLEINYSYNSYTILKFFNFGKYIWNQKGQ